MFVQRSYYVYILASKCNGTIYIGITNNIKRRVYQHKNNLVKGFTQKYNIHSLVYFELFTHVGMAINREKDLKKWKRVPASAGMTFLEIEVNRRNEPFLEGFIL